MEAGIGAGSKDRPSADDHTPAKIWNEDEAYKDRLAGVLLTN